MRSDFFEAIETLWAIAPIPLSILWGKARSKAKKQQRLLNKLGDENRVDGNDYRECGLIPPAYLPDRRTYSPAEMGILPPPAEIQPVFRSETMSIQPESAQKERVLPPIRTERPTESPDGDLFPQTAAAMRQAAEREHTEQPGILNISAISAMLAVGVVLVVVAGLLFVRSQWDYLENGGKLAILGAGSVLFFGVSALAHRLWKLERTGMAFFTIGAAFLPISIWAAGCFELLGAGLSGASNKWTITLAFAAFTVTALAAVPIYKRVSWGIASLCGVSATYVYFTYALTDILTKDRTPVLFCAAIYALLLIFTSHLLKDRLPEPISKAIVPFAVGFAGFACFLQFTYLDDAKDLLAAMAALACAACWFAPSAVQHLKNYAVIPFGIMSFYGFARMLHPLMDIASPYHLVFDHSSWLQLTAIVCVLLCILLAAAKSIPEQMQKGFAKLPFVYGSAALFLFIVDNDCNLILIGGMAVLLAALIAISILQKPAGKRIPQNAAALTAMCIVYSLYDLFQFDTVFGCKAPESALLCAVILGAAAVGFLAVPRLHSGVGGVLFPLGMIGFSCVPAECSDAEPWQNIAGIIIVCLVAVYEWFAALHRDEIKPIRFIYAAGLPITLFLAWMLGDAVMSKTVSDLWLMIVWSAASFAAAAGAYYSAKKEFHMVRRVMFIALMIPMMLAAVIAEAVECDGLIPVEQLLCAAAALWIYHVFSKRGNSRYAMAGCAAGLFLCAEATAYAAANLLYDKFAVSVFRFPVFMIAGIVLIAAGVLAFLIRKRVVFFTGSAEFASVTAAAVSMYAFLLANRLYAVPADAWHSVLFMYTLGFCVLGWMLTKPDSIVKTACSSIALLMGIEAVREHSAEVSIFHLAMVILTAGAMTLLMPYLGTVLREGAETPQNTRRGWTITASGALYPMWLLFTSLGMGGIFYNRKETRWMLFFMMVFLAGYIVHFRFIVKDESRRRKIGAIAGGVLTVAMWIQPVININGTYWENKLHLIPLIAFGAWIRYLYGAAAGGNFLFMIGTYSMLRLGFSAIGTESAADLLTVLLAAAAIFILSFIYKQKKWFVLGGCSLLLLTGYLQMRMMHGIVWWAYLLIIGVILISVAGVNEMMKQRGESLKEKAGRFWQDWTW